MKFLNIMWKKVEELFREELDKIFIISILNFMFYGINKYFYDKYLGHSFYYKGIKFILGYSEFLILCISLGIVICFFNKKIKDKIFQILECISIFTFVIEFFLFLNFKTILNSGIIQILLETNKNESKEFILEQFKIKEVVIVILVLKFIFIISKYFSNKINLNEIFKLKSLRIIIILIVILKITEINKKIIEFGIGRVGVATISAIKNIKEYKDISSKLTTDVDILENKSNIENIIFIIGESTARNHMSLYGYNEKTSPLLKKLELEKKLYKFTDVISPHAHTIPSLKKILTFFNTEEIKEWYKYPNLIDIMKKCGYKTYWFSNQESGGIYGNVAVALGNKSDLLIFNRKRDSDTEIFGVYDEEIVDKSLNILSKEKENKKFIIYHLMGTHARYLNRYPSNFNVFTENSNEKINEYDNAVLYNDYVINKIISNFSNEESIIIYISDHGEEIYDFRDFFGHSETNASRYMLEIPFIIYTSDKFKNKYPEKIKNIENSLKNPYMTDDIIHTILDIADIKTEEYDETRSVINSKFNKERKRIFNGKDYDIYLKNIN